MKRGIVFFVIGLIMLMAGINISAHWPVIGSVMSVAGGVTMGSTAHLLAGKKSKKD
jgi:hypothetical protein